MFGGKKTLGDVWEISAADKAPAERGEESGGDEEGTGTGPARMKMERLAKRLGIEDLDAFAELTRLVNENC